jgi:chemotaxis protein histidine kinase CheA
LTEEAFNTVIRNSTWRSQVLQVQGHVPSKSVITGEFAFRPKVRSLLDSEFSAAADALTKALCKYAESAYSSATAHILSHGHLDEGVGRASTASSVFSRLSNTSGDRPLGLHVREMKATFALDPNERLVFLFANSTYVEVESGRQLLDEVIDKEKAGRELTAAQSVTAELRALLSHAQRRGLSTLESFRHFDMKGGGYFDADMLLDGMSRLGIGSTYPVAELVVQTIAGVGAAFVTLADFERFLSGNLDEDVFVTRTGSTSLSSAGGSGLAAVASRRAASGAASRQRSKQQLQPPGKLYPVPAHSSMLNEGESVPLTSSQTDLNHDFNALDPSVVGKSKRKIPNRSATGTQQPSNTSNSASSLPIPASAYRVEQPNRQATDLPSWTSDRNKRALREIKRAHLRWKEKQDAMAAAGGEEEASAGSQSSKLDEKDVNKQVGSGKSLQGVVKEMSVDLGKNEDEVLHVEHGVIMTYRLLLGHEAQLHYASLRSGGVDQNSPQSELFKQRKWMEENTKTFEEEKNTHLPAQFNEDVGTHHKDRFVAFTLIVFPTLFSSLETLQHQLEQILVKYPWARIVLVGYPGMPNTAWPEGWILNTDLHSRTVLKLLQHLHVERRLSAIAGEPVFLMGLGTGCVCMARFVSEYLPRIRWLKGRVKVVCTVNGMLHFSKQFKSVCKDIRQSLLNAGAIEVNELISSLHLSDSFISATEGGRDKCLSDFWRYRDGLCSDRVDSAEAGSGYVGVLELLKGILITRDDFDGAAVLSNSSLPVLAIQSTDDVFVHPRTAEIYQPDKLPERRHSVTNFADCLDENAVHVCWLKSGHEILQERNSYILGVISNLAQICGIKPTKERIAESLSHAQHDELEDEEELVEEVAEVFDVIAMAEQRREQQARENAAAAEEQKRLDEERFNEKQKRRSEKRERKEARQAELKLQEDAVVELERQEREARVAEEARLRAEKASKEAHEAAEKEKAEAEKRRLKHQAEKEKRSRLAEERQRREQKAIRQAELEIFYERERLAKEQLSEERELIKMAKEDMRSRFAAEYAAALELSFRTAILAKEKAAELMRLRREEAVQRVEKKLAMERAARTQERKRRADAVVTAIKEEQLNLVGLNHGGYDVQATNNPFDVLPLIASSQRIMMDLFECRQKHIEAMKRQIILYQKLETFRKQCGGIDNELRRLKRAIRLIEINPVGFL